jgi:hypothetical protein
MTRGERFGTDLEEAVMAQLRYRSGIFRGGLKKPTKTSGELVFRAIFEPSTSRIQVYIFTSRSTCSVILMFFKVTVALRIYN